MPLDAYPSVHRRTSGATHFQSGLSAEASVAAVYASRGHRVVARRWRGTVGEVDLILSDTTGYIFAEVKASRTFDRAAQRLTRRQIDRIFLTAEEFVGQSPLGGLADMRFDLALVDGTGAVNIRENALAWL